MLKNEWRATVFAAMAVATVASAADRTPKLKSPRPLIQPSQDWRFNEYWQGRTIGPKEFYMADQGPYLRISDAGVAKLKQVGLYERTIPGHINYSYLKNFLPEERAKLKDGAMKTMFERILANKWPVHTIFYHRFRGNVLPSQQLLDIIDGQWIGDGQPETVYRLEPVFHYLKTGKRWVGSSMYLWKPECAIEFFKNDLMPRVEEALPFVRDLDHQWTRPELRTLSDLYCEEFYRPAGRVTAWGMYVGSYHLASLPNTNTVAEKAADALSNARARGTTRQFGGGKFYFVWRGHEPTEMYSYYNRGWFTIRGDEWGLPLPHVRYYIWRPYLIGANYYVNEGFPGSCMQDLEDDGQYELSTLGYIMKDMLDFADRHPDRGTAYSPIALMLDYNRAFSRAGTTYTGYNLPNDDADHMNAGVLGTLFPEHRHAEGAGGYMRTAPYGEIFDIIQPNVPQTGADPKALENYKILFALGGMTFDADFAAKVKEQVRNGSTLVLCASDITPHLDEEFLGFSCPGATEKGGDVLCAVCGHVSREPEYVLHAAKLTSAKAIFEDSQRRPVVTQNRYGKGSVIALLPDYVVEREGRRVTPARGFPYWGKNVLNFVPHFIEHLVVGASPIEVRRAVKDQPDLSWIVAKKGDGWVVTMFNYSCARESIVPHTFSTAKVHAEYPLREVPFEIVCRAPIEDVVEWYEDRDVKWKKGDGEAVVTESMHGGEIRLYEFQPHKIDFGTRERYVNYALNKPVKASSFRKGFEPDRAVNGNLVRDDYWWSDTDPRRHYVFDMPQWLMVDLEAPRIIDHAFVKFHYWEHESLKTRLRIYKYVVEASLDGEQWQTVMDETKNEDNARPEGTERWFEPVEARFVRLTVLRNSSLGGARVIELKAMGPEREDYVARRKSIIPAWEVQYPASVRDVPEGRLTYLIDLEPKKAVPGWLPAGKKWEDLNGGVKLVTTLSGLGRFYDRSIYAQAASELVYSLGGRYKTFVAAAAFGSNKRNSSVEFVVYIDGEEKYKSPLYRVGMPVLPVVVDVSGAGELKLIVTDGGDGITNDYAWWGEARLVRAE